MVGKIRSLGIFGLDAYPVDVEANVTAGKACFDIVGLPDAAVSESRERVASAVANSGLAFLNNHITVNLAPADKKKEGSIYDLPILLAYLKSTNQLKINLDDSAFIGELSLSGEVRHVRGVLPMLICAAAAGFKKVYVPADNAFEAAAVGNITVYPVKSVKQLMLHFSQTETIEPVEHSIKKTSRRAEDILDFADVKGQSAAKRALEVAAAGGHNCLLIGPPGSGKSMLAKRLPSILPDMTFDEALEVTKLYSIAGRLPENQTLIEERPFRSPHHSISPVGLSGGGSVPKPGEISLAHNGVLFLDELPEFGRSSLEILRQPLEDGKITIARAAGTVAYPSSVMLVAAMNPCPCGYYGHPTIPCTCSVGAPARYLSRVSGPLLDRMDIHIEVSSINYDQLTSKLPAESSADVKKRVNAARKLQDERFKGTGISCNAKMTSAMTREYCVLEPSAEKLLRDVFDRLGLSARAYDKILKLSRTIADLEGSEKIDAKHLAEAVQYRSLDRKFWRAGEK